MAIRFRCPYCKKSLKLTRPEKMGQPMQCPNPDCQKWMIFGASTIDEEPQEEAIPQPTSGDRTQPQPSHQWGNRPLADEVMFNRVKKQSETPPIPGKMRLVDLHNKDHDATEEIQELPPMPKRSQGPPPQRHAAPPIYTTKKRSSKGLWIGLIALTLLVVGGTYLIVTNNGNSTTTNTNTNEDIVESKGPFGIIEISTAGVKAIVVEPYYRNGEYDYEMKYKFEDKNISSGNLQEDGKTFDPNTLEATRNAVQEFFDDMRSKHQLPVGRIAVIRSSGVIAGFKNVEVLEQNRKLLNDIVRKITTQEMDEFTPFYEAKYTAQFVIHSDKKTESLLMDIGSGNIKGGYFNSDGHFLSTDVNMGTKRFAKAILAKIKEDKKDEAKDFDAIASSLRDTLVTKEFKSGIANNGALATKNRVYLCGGITWALRTFTHPTEDTKKLYVEIKLEDIKAFQKLVQENTPDQLKKKLLDQVEDESQKKAIEKEIANVQKVFNPQELKAGAELLNSLADTYEFSRKMVLFYSKGPVAPQMGYVLTRLGMVK
jgi:hypothetical protein